MKNLSDFKSLLRKLMFTASSEARGWKAVIQDEALLSGELMHVYVFDVATRWTWMASIDRHEFLAAAAKGKQLDESSQIAVRAMLLESALQLVNNNDIQADTEFNLAMAVGLYAGATATFEAAGGYSNGGHFCVMLYRQPGQTQNISIRPFNIPSEPNQPVEASKLLGMVETVVEHDMDKHPEWFFAA